MVSQSRHKVLQRCFLGLADRSRRRYLHGLVKDCVEDWEHGKFVSIYEMTNEEHDDLIRRHICFHDPDAFAIYGGLGRDWPDARGIYCNDWIGTPNVMIWCNAEDHIRVVSMRKGGDLHGVFAALLHTVLAAEKALQLRGHKFVYDDRLGYVSTMRELWMIMPNDDAAVAMLFRLCVCVACDLTFIAAFCVCVGLDILHSSTRVRPIWARRFVPVPLSS